ncbi:MAG: type III secretion system inner membrane ring subunit SctD [Chlamydiae bacterium]|nr:type III secretion system inner membrane ring subunit SctD [Chlamydiota bacterium]
MAGFLLAEEGTLSGLIIRFEEGEEWILGRDPDISYQALEDPMVSRKHVICRLTPEGFLFENLSAVNPATQNGKVITEAVLLREGDIIQIGNTYFRFTEFDPLLEKEEALADEEGSIEESSFDQENTIRWMLKVIAGPNSGAEFSMKKNSSYIVGKDPNTCDIVFQDLSVSRQHARLTVSEDEVVTIEDLGSRNGVIVNGQLITDPYVLSSQDLLALGTTSFLVIDREQVRETIVSPVFIKEKEVERVEAAAMAMEAPAREEKVPVDWKNMIIPYRHLFLGGGLLVLAFILFIGIFSLFQSEKVEMIGKNPQEQIQEAIAKYQDLQFSFNEASGKLFLIGHVLTPVDKMEVQYLLASLPFIDSIEDNVVIDEYVSQSMNSLLVTNPNWVGVSVQAPTPGRFILTGYLQTAEQAQTLTDYVNINFPYLDKLDNQVVVEANLINQVQGMLFERGFSNVQFQITNGEIVFAGRIDERQSSSLASLLAQLKAEPGVRSVKNYIVMVTEDSARVDLSSQYQVVGYSKQDDSKRYVVINGRILAEGNSLDGMLITEIEANSILLEKDGLKFRINYNLQ